MAMKKLLPFILVLILIVSCSQQNLSDTGYISFSTEVSRGITASIEYPSLLDKTWNLTATKTDGGASTGAGTYEAIVLTDSLGPFSIGTWTFTITSSDNKITGTVNTTIHPGSNSIAITVRSTAAKGTLSVENCNFLISSEGNVTYVDLYIDNERINTNWVTANLQSEDGNCYTLPTVTETLSEGVHTVRLYYATDSGGHSSDTISVRVVKGCTTHFSIGEQEGNMMLSISFNEVDAIVE